MAATPVLGEELTQATAKASVQAGKDVAETAKDVTSRSVRKATRLTSDARRKVTKATVRVNRTVPKTATPNIDPMFGMNVTTDALMRARVFPEHLVPTAEPTAEDNAALARMLERMAIAPRDRQLAIVDEHVQQHPTSAWRASLIATAGTLYSREGYFSRAASYWTQAWELTRANDDSKVKVLADYALGESVAQMVKFGQVERLEARLKEADGRDVRGPAGTQVADGREGLYLLREKHHLAIFSGPEALKMYLTVRPIDNLDQAVRAITKYHPSVEGTTMTELRNLGDSVGLHLSMWRASSIERFPVPSIVHLRSQHFSAIVGYENGRYRLRDPGLGGDTWLTADALRDESSGFVMTNGRPSGEEWRPVSDGEGQLAVGHCQPGKSSVSDPPCPFCGGPGPGGPPPPGPPPPGPPGMPYYGFHPSSAALILEDLPLTYTPSVGPDVSFRLAYNHNSYKSPSTFGYGHVGPLWTFNGVSYVTDNTTFAYPPYSTTSVYLRGHGKENYTPFETVHVMSGAALVQVSHDPAHYERRLPDGSVEVFTLADRAASLSGRRIFLTETTDPQGHTIA
ncbi:MAG TPA: cysteine peptidase family C39 domain-containing protein, partial [Vicinamibacterales bacterium]|nr:cysteine peptidase family C39 domain-containing protein [Vicinamibacterales bacterium]